MAIPILRDWKKYFLDDRNEGLGSSYERVMLNRKLEEVRVRYAIRSALEAPVFGFTGLSGINSLWLARQGTEMHLIETDPERSRLITQIWNEVHLPVKCIHQPTYETLPFDDQSIDFAWNFSAMWFLNDMDAFLQELMRVVTKAIMICVPNRSGLGYLSQKYVSGVDLREALREEYIIPRNIVRSMTNSGWHLNEHNYIDCPPWPDIGMAKEDFLKLFGLGFLVPRSPSEVPFYSILDLYSEKDPLFEQKMLRYSWFENTIPRIIKFFWAHHKYFIFTPV